MMSVTFDFRGVWGGGQIDCGKEREDFDIRVRSSTAMMGSSRISQFSASSSVRARGEGTEKLWLRNRVSNKV